MGFLFELLFDVVGSLVGDLIADAIGPKGCAAIIAVAVLAVALLIWLT